MRTSCQNCQFAIVKDIQVGCELGRLDKFHELGVTTAPTKGEEADWFPGLSDTHYTIERRCTTRREAPWGDGLSLAEQIKKVKQEVSLRCEALIYVSDDHTLEQVENTVKSCVGQTHKFKSIHVINNSLTYRKGQLLSLLKKFDDECQWKLKTTVLDNGALPSMGAALNMGVRHVTVPFYSFMEAGWVAPTDYLQSINHKLNEELLAFLIIDGESNHNGMIVTRFLHNYAGEYNDSDSPIDDFLNHLAANEECASALVNV